jgi:hypothetical protein
LSARNAGRAQGFDERSAIHRAFDHFDVGRDRDLRQSPRSWDWLRRSDRWRGARRGRRCCSARDDQCARGRGSGRRSETAYRIRHEVGPARVGREESAECGGDEGEPSQESPYRGLLWRRAWCPMWVRVGTTTLARDHRIEDHVEDRHGSRTGWGRGSGRDFPCGGVERLHVLRAVPVTRISHDEGPTMQTNALASWNLARESRDKPRLALC